jgi:ribosomal protein L13
MKALMAYAETWKQPINFQKTLWILFNRQVAPKFDPDIDCGGHVITHCNEIKYLGTWLDSKLSFSSHIKFIESKIRKNINIFKHLNSTRMLSEAVAFRLFNAFVRPHYQSLLNIYPILPKTKQDHLEALNRQIFRTIHHG